MSGMAKWEVLFVLVSSNLEADEKRLNALGTQGWELVTVESNIYYLKRLIERGENWLGQRT